LECVWRWVREGKKFFRSFCFEHFGLLCSALPFGAILAAGLNRLLISVLAEVRPLEFVVIASASTTLMVIALLASYIPAGRAAPPRPHERAPV
jgi:ABC-type lipoprotein release transport system permease subunit